jgi:hypothetical protein
MQSWTNDTGSFLSSGLIFFCVWAKYFRTQRSK